ncbi:Protein RER1 [Collichthys lucidus]|uniref:Protein RER1 n=1 Tax=Collichthys lucidus TaxID=240159 RepID=A0A4U5URA2_COLLU|nr:Protein RER1 [Collichthys lucidus]
MSEGDSVGESIHGKPSVVAAFFTRIGQIYQSWLDKSTPFYAVRWAATLLLTAVYMIRVYILQTYMTHEVNDCGHSATKGIVIAMICTFFDAFNVPVFWPILVMYFIMLFCITMKRQIKHMVKYRYLPFTHGKRTYKGKEETGKTFAS